MWVREHGDQLVAHLVGGLLQDRERDVLDKAAPPLHPVGMDLDPLRGDQRGDLGTLPVPAVQVDRAPGAFARTLTEHQHRPWIAVVLEPAPVALVAGEVVGRRQDRGLELGVLRHASSRNARVSVLATLNERYDAAGRTSPMTSASRCAAVLAAVLVASPSAHAAEPSRWIGTWTASAQPIWDTDFFPGIKLPRTFWNQTIRQVARVSIGGSRVRVVLSNEYGTRPVTIGAAHAALSDGGAKIAAGSDRVLTFGGLKTVIIPPGAPVVSDPVELPLAPLASVAVSLYLPDPTPVTTWHNDARQTAFLVSGNKTAEVELKPDDRPVAYAFLTEILVDAPATARAIVAFGDSITDGDCSTIDANRRWPDILAERLVKAGGPPVAVLNQGISGAKVLADRMGVNALARFERDVLAQPHVDTVIVMIGINDIGWAGAKLLSPDDPPASVERIIAGYRQLIDRAHMRGIKVIGATLTPFEDAFKGAFDPLADFYSPAKEKARQAVNKWIREGRGFDAVIDFDARLRDARRPARLQAAFACGDHLHPSDAGYKAMAESIDLKLLGVGK
jgi:lysophospholipase L1-like esterase